MNWSLETKQLARQRTIIDPYREHFGYSIPSDLEYWSMAGQCATDDGEPLPGCEFDQVVEAGLVTPEQFHGVEQFPRIHRLNQRAYPEANWHRGDFYQVLHRNARAYRPAIVNADLIETAISGADYIGRIMDLLSLVACDVMLVANFVVKYRGGYVEPLDYLQSSWNFTATMASGLWTPVLDYEYGGRDGTSKTVMGSLVFVKQCKGVVCAEN